MNDRILHLALAVGEDEAAARVLGDVVQEEVWDDVRLLPLVGWMYERQRRHPWEGSKWVKGRPGRRRRLWLDWARAVAAVLLFGEFSTETWVQDRWPKTAGLYINGRYVAPLTNVEYTFRAQDVGIDLTETGPRSISWSIHTPHPPVPPVILHAEWEEQ